MSKKSIPSTWIGYYAYDQMDDVEFAPPAVTFKLSLEFGWFGRFKGSVHDGPGSGMPETGHVKGYIRNNKIEFTKYMPVGAYMNEDGTTTRVNCPHPPIHYFGKFDNDFRSLSGRWYIEAGFFWGQEFEEASGTWTAKPG